MRQILNKNYIFAKSAIIFLLEETKEENFGPTVFLKIFCAISNTWYSN